MKDDLTRRNERAWDDKTPYHVNTKFYDPPSFLNGQSTLKGVELDLCGSVAGLDLLHLQCHIGLDTLSWARLGARVTGVDFSGEAIASARQLADRAGIEATFLKSDVQRLPTTLNDRFDLVVSTYGALCWLGDLETWANGIARVLRPSGRFVLVEFHPILDVIHGGCISNRHTYFGNGARELKSRGTYANRDADITFTEYLWQHPVSEVVTALINAHLRLDSQIEYPFCSYQIVTALDEEVNGYWRSSENPNRVPYLYSLVASR
jgi:ubiquinone/menaquinone biosynthesis C-methylase UbiE